MPDSNFSNYFNIKDYEIDFKFPSKKNEVFKIKFLLENKKNKRGVIKYFGRDTNAAKKEILILRMLHERGMAVPQIYNEGKNYILMEYISGQTMLDLMEILEFEPRENSEHVIQGSHKLKGIIKKVCSYLKDFYDESKKATGKSLILGDMNLRNFILKKSINGDKLYRVDFEDCRNGCIEEDLGSFCAFILNYFPEYSEWKVNFTKKFFISFRNYFQVNSSRIKKEIKKNIKMLNLRREETYNNDLVNSILGTFK